MEAKAASRVDLMATLLRVVLLVGAMALAASCAGTTSLRATESLDENTGATVTRVDQPLVLASDDPARAANSRDYVYAAPFAVSQAGKRSWWLWLGVWSTIDRGVSPGGQQLQPEVSSVMLLVDGEPMELDMGARADSIPGLAQIPYAAPVSTARNILLPLSRSQVSRLSRAASINVRTEMGDSGALLFQTWAQSSSWQDFAELAVADPRPLP